MQRCPECDSQIRSNDINIQEGVALCPDCGVLSRLSELHEADQSIELVFDDPPHGCSIDTTMDSVSATASARSIGGFFLSLGIAVFWNGIVSVFALIALAGLYTNLIGPLPEWFPAPVAEGGKPEMNGEPMGLGMTLFLCAFLTPFLLIGAAMISAVLVSAFGRVEVSVNEFESFVGIGIGFVMWKRRFDPAQMRSIEMEYRSTSDNNTHPVIELIADRTIRFGSMLPAGRKKWLHAAIRTVLMGSRASRRRANIPELSWMA